MHLYTYIYMKMLCTPGHLFLKMGRYQEDHTGGAITVGGEKIIVDSMEGRWGQAKFFFLSAFQFVCVAAPFYLEYIIMAEIKVKFIYSEEVK